MTAGVSGQPKWMFSATVIGFTSRKCWWTMPMPASMAWAGLRKSRSTPSMVTWPVSARYMPARMLHRVVLPAPFSPTRAWTSDHRTSKSTASRAATPPKALQMLRASTAGRASSPVNSVRACCRDQAQTPETPSTAQSIS